MGMQSGYTPRVEMQSQAGANASKLVTRLERERCELDGLPDGQAAIDDVLNALRQLQASLQLPATDVHDENERV